MSEPDDDPAVTKALETLKASLDKAIADSPVAGTGFTSWNIPPVSLEEMEQLLNKSQVMNQEMMGTWVSADPAIYYAGDDIKLGWDPFDIKVGWDDVAPYPYAKLKPNPVSPVHVLASAIPGLREGGTRACPGSISVWWEAPSRQAACLYTQGISQMIIHLNDDHGWTRERIADWLETLDVDLRFEAPE